MTTIVEVARKAGVSVSTVSHVVNGTRHVSPATAQLVKDAIENVGYLPNTLARSLKRSSTSSVGLAISAISTIAASGEICEERNAIQPRRSQIENGATHADRTILAIAAVVAASLSVRSVLRRRSQSEVAGKRAVGNDQRATGGVEDPRAVRALPVGHGEIDQGQRRVVRYEKDARADGIRVRDAGGISADRARAAAERDARAGSVDDDIRADLQCVGDCQRSV